MSPKHQGDKGGFTWAFHPPGLYSRASGVSNVITCKNSNDDFVTYVSIKSYINLCLSRTSIGFVACRISAGSVTDRGTKCHAGEIRHKVLRRNDLQ